MPAAVPELVCGLDEAGRGALAGPVIAAAVIYPSEHYHPRITDSKRLSAGVRERLAGEIMLRAVEWALGAAEPSEVASLNVVGASMLAMRRAFKALKVSPDLIVVDGLHYPSGIPPGTAMVRGDSRVLAVSAASILAKVHRDGLMRAFGKRYPRFSFAQHKGYPTPQHLAELAEYGPASIHRTSFRPVAQMMAREAGH
jgi:ribonuclease HII